MTRTLTPFAGSATWYRNKKATTASLDSDLLRSELYANVDLAREANAYPRQRNYHGKWSMASTGQAVWFESLLERDNLRRLDQRGNVVSIASQPMKLTNQDGAVHYPDFLALDADGNQTVYDVKPSEFITPKVRAQFEWTREVCEAVGWQYRVLTELSPQHLVNLKWLANFRQAGHYAGEDAVRTLRAAATPNWTFEDAVHAMPASSSAQAVSHVAHLMWTGTLTFDMNSRLGNNTSITFSSAP